ncbi:MAG: pyridoxal phosphate-dependent aminotransferase family protein [Phycisphaeraceae bacterium]|nr:pyridoxal phosphate-dependent aminotransferase family protein [Phycisphaeraceae bacterium]MCW5753349.1 pyridoxal phosphate-dependent aminotransferase family protein [Phycisphaeraceae bacterium]
MPRLSVSFRTATTCTVKGREVVTFGGCDYLGLAHHPAVIEALRRGVDDYGLSASASRETTGNTIAHDRLEQRLAEFAGLDSALLVSEGYLANVTLCQTLVDRYSVALVDDRAHRSLADAARAVGMRVLTYPHLDAGAASRLAHANPRAMVLTDGVFTADGALAPLPELLAGLPGDGVLVVDDCHGFGVLGPRGRGTLEHFGLNDPRLIVTTTLAKGIGVYGGAIIGGRDLIMQARGASAYRCVTPIPPAIAVAAKAALDVHACELALVRRLRANASHMRDRLIERQLSTTDHHPHVPIFAFTLDSRERMQTLSDEALAAGFLVPLIEYPGGPAPAYFRLSVSALHESAQIEALMDCLSAALAAV